MTTSRAAAVPSAEDRPQRESGVSSGGGVAISDRLAAVLVADAIRERDKEHRSRFWIRPESDE